MIYNKKGCIAFQNFFEIIIYEKKIKKGKQDQFYFLTNLVQNLKVMKKIENNYGFIDSQNVNLGV